jgi:hypothetical protein
MSDENDTNKQSKKKSMWIGIGIGIGGAVLILVLVLFWMKRRHNPMSPSAINILNSQRILENPNVSAEMIKLLK